jgi:hypothetical protein
MLFNSVKSEDIFGMTKQDEQLITEAVLCDVLSKSELQELTETADVCNELKDLGVVTEKTIVRLDKKAKLSRAFKTAVFTIAREKKDPKFKKLLTVWKMERALEAYLMKKYQAEATKRAKLAVARLGKGNKDTKNGVVAKASKKAKADAGVK